MSAPPIFSCSYAPGSPQLSSTILATCIFKEVLHKYNAEKSPIIYACFLDMSRAFERVNHKLIIEKMYKKTHSSIVNIFRDIFLNSTVKGKYF